MQTHSFDVAVVVHACIAVSHAWNWTVNPDWSISKQGPKYWVSKPLQEVKKNKKTNKKMKKKWKKREKLKKFLKS